MFAPRFFAPTYFAPRYFPPVLEIITITIDRGSSGDLVVTSTKRLRDEKDFGDILQIIIISGILDD